MARLKMCSLLLGAMAMPLKNS